MILDTETYYQQVYAAADFPGAMTIGSITFFHDLGTPGDIGYPGAINPSDYTFFLSTTSKPVGGLSDTFADNQGADEQLFFQGPLSGAIDPATNPLTITGVPFQYNPSAGNLLLTIASTTPGYPGNMIYLDALIPASQVPGKGPGDTGQFSREYTINGVTIGQGDSNGIAGLVTAFSTPAVPEPSPVALLSLGLLPVGLMIRARRRQRGARQRPRKI